MNVESRSAAGMRSFARSPPSNGDGSAARKSAVPRVRVVVEFAEDLQQADARGGRVRAAALHRGDLDVAAVGAAPRLHERGESVRVRDRPVEQLQAQRDEKAGVGAAGRRAGRLAVAAVGRAERFERGGDAVAPVGRRVGEHVRPAAERDEVATHDQREEIDHARGAGHLRAEEAGGLAADVRG